MKGIFFLPICVLLWFMVVKCTACQSHYGGGRPHGHGPRGMEHFRMGFGSHHTHSSGQMHAPSMHGGHGHGHRSYRQGGGIMDALFGGGGRERSMHGHGHGHGHGHRHSHHHTRPHHHRPHYYHTPHINLITPYLPIIPSSHVDYVSTGTSTSFTTASDFGWGDVFTIIAVFVFVLCFIIFVEYMAEDLHHHDHFEDDYYYDEYYKKNIKKGE